MDIPHQNKPRGPFLAKISAIVDHSYFTNAIIFLIIINAIIVGLETYPNLYVPYSEWFFYADRLLLWLFTVEIVLRLIAVRPTRTFFRDPWNIFDFVIVLSGHIFVGAHFITVLRVLRILRVLRAISVIPSLRKIVNALLRTIPALGNIMLLMSLIFYIFGVLGTMLFSQVAPAYFGSLHVTLLTLFQMVTLDSWASGMLRPLLTEVSWAWIYFISFILVGTFVIFNLFVGVIVSNVEKADSEEQAEAERKNPALHPNYELKQEVTHLRQEIAELKSILLQKERQKVDKKK